MSAAKLLADKVNANEPASNAVVILDNFMVSPDNELNNQIVDVCGSRNPKDNIKRVCLSGCLFAMTRILERYLKRVNQLNFHWLAVF
jgi:hydrogenase maturation factor HypF (carbamoyltransferase family)